MSLLPSDLGRFMVSMHCKSPLVDQEMVARFDLFRKEANPLGFPQGSELSEAESAQRYDLFLARLLNIIR